MKLLYVTPETTTTEIKARIKELKRELKKTRDPFDRDVIESDLDYFESFIKD